MAGEKEVPKIEYPDLYTFRVICKQLPGIRDAIRKAVQSVVGLLPDDAVTERPSAKGNYVAVHVVCLLTSEEQRIAVYLRLKEEPGAVLSL